MPFVRKSGYLYKLENADMINIAVFCSACQGVDECYVHAASAVGRVIGSAGDALVYGGASLGLMEVLAASVRQSGGTVTGVVPRLLEERNAVSSLCNRLVMVKDLDERKAVMNSMADMFVALPGGVGTLDEVFTVVAARSIGYHTKPVVLYNTAGFYDTLISFIGELKQKGFLRHDTGDYFLVADNEQELEHIIGTCRNNSNNKR